MKRPIYVVDAFSAQALRGNPAAVVLDGADLDDRTMQRIAAEMRHSETAFALPARDPAATFHLRWFTPANEVRFCGHATLAAIRVLVEEVGRLRVHAGATVRTAFTCKAGLLRVELSRDAKKRLQVRFETPRAEFVESMVPVELLSSLGLVPEALDPTVGPRQSAASHSADGNLYLCVRDRETLAKVKLDPRGLLDAARAQKTGGVVVYTLAPAEGVDAAVRGFFPGDGVDEDPVTGSAAGQLATLLQLVRPADLPRKLVFTQGTELGREGRIEIDVRPETTPGDVRAWIGGEGTVVLRGELDLRALVVEA